MSDEITASIRTRELRLVDQSGQDRVVLSTADDGAVSMSFLDGGASPRVSVSIAADGRASLEIGHGAGTPGFSLQVDKDGTLLMQALDNEGVERLKLELKGNGSHTELAFSEKYKRPRMVLMAEDKGPAGLFILDQHGKALFSTLP